MKKLWDAETGEEIRTFTGHSDWVGGCAFSLNGTKILSASDDKTVKLWDAKTGAELMTFRTRGGTSTISINSCNLIAAGDGTGWLYILQPHNI
jgi:WD40 repeat protein